MFTPDQFWTEADYRREYDKGWRKSKGDTTLGEAEWAYLQRNNHSRDCDEHNAWLDGWLDFAAGRDKYHSQHCPNKGDDR